MDRTVSKIRRTQSNPPNSHSSRSGLSGLAWGLTVAITILVIVGFWLARPNLSLVGWIAILSLLTAIQGTLTHRWFLLPLLGSLVTSQLAPRAANSPSWLTELSWGLPLLISGWLILVIQSRVGYQGFRSAILADLAALIGLVSASIALPYELLPAVGAALIFVREGLMNLLNRSFPGLVTIGKPEVGVMTGWKSIVLASMVALFALAAQYFERFLPTVAFLIAESLIFGVAVVVAIRAATYERLTHQGILGLCNLLHYAHPYTGGHSKRVAALARMTGLQVGVPTWKIDQFVRAALLHDIGKIAIDERILEKPSRLTDGEFAVIKTHPIIGEEILRPLSEMGEAHRWIRHHHERIDGNGYPDQIVYRSIPIESRVICAIDAFDAMTDHQSDGHRRLYREPVSIDRSLEELQRCSGSQFDARIVQTIQRVVRNKWIGKVDSGGALVEERP